MALIGCGGIARSHAAAYERLADRVEVAYCVDPNAEHAARLAEQLGGRPVADYDGILEDVDAVDICTPHHLHYPAARDALSVGVNVFVEKPMANHRAECLELVELADERGCVLMVGYVLRYMPASQALCETLAAGTYGELIQIASSVEALVSGERLPWAAIRDQLGGGVLFSHGCHTIDLMLAAAGPARRVAMFGNNVGAEWMEGEGTSQVIIEFASGALGHHTSSWAMAHKNAIPTLRAWCREGYLEIAGRTLAAHVGSERHVLCDPPADDPGPFYAQIEHFVDCLQTGGVPLTNGRAALPSLELIWGAYESRETGRVVELA